MNTYEFVFRISPPSAFGLPEEGFTTIIPSVAGEYTGPAIDTRTLNIVEYGTLPKYREEKDKINKVFDLDGTKCRLTDNFLFAKIDAENSDLAYSRVMEVVEKFLLTLQLFQRNRFDCELIQITDQANRKIPQPRSVTMAKVHMYNLAFLDQNIDKAKETCQIYDTTLAKSLSYMSHALFLNELHSESLFSKDGPYLLSEIFLNICKAVTTLLGEPKEKAHRTRYEKFGIDYDSWHEKVDEIWRIRNQYDVAHYQLSDEKLHKLNEVIGKSMSITFEIISKYVEYLKKQKANQVFT